MRTHKSFLIGLIVICLFHLNNAQAEDTTINVNAVIQVAASITNTVDLDFGTIIADPSGDVITIDATNATGGLSNTSASSATANVSVGSTSTITNSNSGRVDISTAISDVAISVDFPAGSSITLANGSGDNMTVSGIDTNSSADFTSGTANTYYVHIGGALTIAAGQPAGTYTGTIDITINYN